MQAEKAAFRPCARTEGALAHHGQTLVPGADRRHLRLEGDSRCTVELADYSIVRSVAAALDLPGSGPQGQVRRHLRRKRSKTKGKIEILHTVKERLKQTDVGSPRRLGKRHTRGSGARVPARACRQGSEAACRGKSHHDSGSVSKAEVGLLQGRPLEMLPPDRGKEFAGHADVTDAL
jgi:hypothetical protein